MPAAVQAVLGAALALVVVTVVGLLAMVSQGPQPGICGALAACGGLAPWGIRLFRGGFYRPMAIAMCAGAAAAVGIVLLCVASIRWG